MVLRILIGSLLYNVFLAWATLHKPLLPPLDKPYPHPHLQTKMSGYILLFSNHNQKFNRPQSSYKVTSFLDFQLFLKVFNLFINI